MKLLFLLVGFLAFLPTPVSSQSSTLMSNSIPSRDLPTAGHSRPSEFNLSDHQWQHRLVLVFAPSGQSPDYQQQLQIWQKNHQGIQERHLKRVEILATGESRRDGQPLNSASAQRLRQQFEVNPSEFLVLLVGKDGTVKHRSQSPVTLATLFSVIDAMPMRRQEMRSQP